MAGIYIHIPFCKSKCNYCDFFKETDNGFQDRFVNALLNEIALRKAFLSGKTIQTIYFGGGTPSLLSIDSLVAIFSALDKNFTIATDTEITIEANPDDCTNEFLTDLKKYTQVNRLSLGIQSFYDKDLKLMGRRHDAQQSKQTIETCIQKGFTNLGIDLIYGLPNQDLPMWESNLRQAFGYQIKHLSAYHLTYEQDTVFWHWKNKGKIKPVSENDSVDFMNFLMQYAKEVGFDHYEISNFAHPGYYSKHNMSYWQQVEYLGLGPSAHSYSGKIRSWNKPNLEKYISNIENKIIYCESETIDEITAFNEYVMLSLRTKWGIDLRKVRDNFSSKLYNYLLKEAERYLEKNVLLLNEDTLVINRSQLLITDAVITDLFFVE